MPSSSHRESFWRGLIAARETSNLTVRAVCEKAGVSPASFFYWRKRLLRMDSAGASTTDAALPAASLAPVRILDDRVREITLELPCGLRIRVPPGCDEFTLQRVLRVAATTYRSDASC